MPADWIDRALSAPKKKRVRRDLVAEQLEREKREHGWGPPPPTDRTEISSHPERTAELQRIREAEGDTGLADHVAATLAESVQPAADT